MPILLKEQKKTGQVLIENMYYDSSSLAKTSYNYDTQQLTVTFQKGNVYSYHEVPQDVYESLTNAEKAGSFFSTNISRNYTYINKGNVGPGFIAEELAAKLPPVL